MRHQYGAPFIQCQRPSELDLKNSWKIICPKGVSVSHRRLLRHQSVLQSNQMADCDFALIIRTLSVKQFTISIPSALMQETLNLLRGATLYTNLDVCAAYILLQVREGDEHKLAFSTRYGSFEGTVAQFGMTNALADFQGYLHNTRREAVDDFASAYLDDIVIYSNSEEELVEHVKWVMQYLLDASLDWKPEICKFHKETVGYLWLIISTKRNING